jgi:hypothetical protein
VSACAAVSVVDLVVHRMVGSKLMNWDCNISFIWVALMANGGRGLWCILGVHASILPLKVLLVQLIFGFLVDRKGIPRSI